MSLRYYSGEYLIVPVPLHLNLDACTQGCGYCFAVLNSPKYRADWDQVRKKVLKAKSDQPIGKDLTAWFLRQGYPVLVSNQSDPFAKMVNDGFMQVKELFDEHGIRMTYQTKGGTNAMDLLPKEKPTLVYISITSDNNDTLKKYEVNAPPFEERLALAIACKQAGHDVEVAINPFIPSWWDDLPAFLDTLLKHDLKKIVWDVVHMSARQAVNVSSRFKEMVPYAMKKTKPDQGYMREMELYMQKIGINTCRKYSSKGGWWDEYYKILPWFPTLDDWFTKLRQIQSQTGKPVRFTLVDFNQYCSPAFPPFESSSFLHYLMGVGMQIRKIHGGDPRIRSFQDVNWWLFDILQIPSIFFEPGITVCVEDDDPESPVIEHDQCVLVFNGDVTTDQRDSPWFTPMGSTFEFGA